MVVPVKVAGTAGTVVKANVLAALELQLFAVTEMEPEVNDAKLTVIDVLVVVIGDVPAEDVIPVGNVHV